MRIAVFDYKIIPTNPIGGCHLRLLRGLSREHEFTVFAAEFENPDPARIAWVRVPVPARPLALLFAGYHLLAPLLYALYRLRGGRRFDLVQMVESNLLFGDLSYSHFCHSTYLREHGTGGAGSALRRALRWLDHWLHSLVEPWIYRHVKHIVVPSRGLGRELVRRFPGVASKLTVVPNAVDVDRLRPPLAFDREVFRAGLGLRPEEPVFVFAALGQFERKGLPLLLDALRTAGCEAPRLLVVGGEADLIAAYRARVARDGLAGRVVFAGMQRDVRPYFWAADAFVFPSAYETFSLVTYEAAAAGLPVIAPRLNGVDDLIEDGVQGLVIERSVPGVADGIRRFLHLSPAERAAMGERAQRGAAGYNEAQFCERWRAFYQARNAAAQQSSVLPAPAPCAPRPESAAQPLHKSR